MNLLALISWPYVRMHLVRTLLTTAGIMLGVSVFVGMHTANRTVLSAFHDTVDRIAGSAELQVTAGDAGFGEDVLERVQAVRGVRVAVPVIEAVVDSNIEGQGNLLVLGIDMTGDRSLREYDLESADDAVLEDPLVFLAQPDSIILTSEFTSRTGIVVGDRLHLGTVVGKKPFTVRGVMRSSGLARAFGGSIAVMDIYATQKMFGRGRTFDRIDLAVKPDTTIEAVQGELAAILGPAFEVQPPASRGQQFEAVLAGYSIMVNVSSAFALFIGMFIIYNAFAIAVTQRRFEIGVLRALGATRRQIRWLFLGESAVLGLVGSLIGAVAGVGVARLIASSIGVLLADVYAVSQRADDLATDPMVLGAAIIIGVATSLVAAAIPARAAAAVDPVHALQKGRYQLLSSRESRIRMAMAAVCATGAAASLLFGGSRPIFYVGYVLVVVAALLLARPLSSKLAMALRVLLKRLWPVEGALAADSLIQAPRRTSAAVTALMLSLGLVVAFSGMARASYDSIVDWVDVTLNADLFVLPSQSLNLQAARFPVAMESEIASLPGVARVQSFRNGRIRFRGRPAMIAAIDITSLAQTSPRQPVAGNMDEMYRAAAEGRGVIVSDNLAELHGLRLGDTIEVPAPYGVIRLPIAGVIVDYSDQQGTILIDWALFKTHWRDDSASDFRVYVAPGSPVAEVRERIIRHYAGQRQVFVLTNDQLRSYILDITNQWFGLTAMQTAVAVLVAVLGIVNTLTVSIIDRRRELGVLQAVGALRRQVRRTIWIEAIAVAAIGVILGCVFGAINLHYVLDIVRRDVAGMRLDYMFPAQTALMLVPMILGAGFVAAIWPAESAVRGSLVEALEYE